MLSEFPTKHASNSPITFVTLKSFVIRFFLPCCSVNSLMIKDDWRGVRPRLQLTRLPPAFHQPSLLRRRQKRQERIGGREDGKLEEGIGERFLFTLSRQPPKPHPPPVPPLFTPATPITSTLRCSIRTLPGICAFRCRTQRGPQMKQLVANQTD